MTRQPQRGPASVRAGWQALHLDRRRGQRRRHRRQPRRADGEAVADRSPQDGAVTATPSPPRIPTWDARAGTRSTPMGCETPGGSRSTPPEAGSRSAMWERALARRSTTRPGSPPRARTSAGRVGRATSLNPVTPVLTPPRSRSSPIPIRDGCSVIGGYVVHDPGLPTLAGRYLYTDLCHGDIRSFVPQPRRRERRPEHRAPDLLADLLRRGTPGADLCGVVRRRCLPASRIALSDTAGRTLAAAGAEVSG